MKKIAKDYLDYIIDGLFKTKLKGKKKTYNWMVYSVSIWTPLLVMLLYAIHDYFTGYGYHFRDDVIAFGFIIACVTNTYLGIKIGRELVNKEQQRASYELIEGLTKQLEEVDGVNDGK